MDVEKSDSFSVSSTSQSIENRCSRISLSWTLVFVKRRFSTDQPVRSPIFQFCNRSWELTVTSANYNKSDERYISSIQLICVDEIISSTITIYLSRSSILNDKGKILHENHDRKDMICFCKNSPPYEILRSACGFSEYFDLERAGSSFTISLNMLSEENTKQALLASKVIKDEKRDPLLIYESILASDFEELYENSQLSDVTLKLGDEEFPAHKSVLSARSKVFAAMFEHDMVENRQSTVDLVQMETETVQDMLRYVYCAKVRELSSVEALHLYVAADRYDLEELRAICREAVVRDISTDNVFDIAAVADVHNDELLIRELKSFISKNGKDIIKNEKWQAIRANNPALGLKMFEWLVSGE